MTVQDTPNESRKRIVFEQFAARATLLAAIYIGINLIYQQSYLAALGYEFGFMSIVSSLPVVSNFVMAIWAFIVWGYISEIPNSSYSQFITFFNLSTWRKPKILVFRASVLIIVLSFYFLSQAVYLGQNLGYGDLAKKTAFLIFGLAILAGILVYTYIHTKPVVLLKRLRRFSSLSTGFIFLLSIVLIAFLMHLIVIAFLSLYAILEQIGVFTIWNNSRILQNLAKEFTWRMIWPTFGYLTSDSTILTFIIPCNLMIASMMIYRGIRRKGIFQALPKIKNLMIILINLIYPALFLQVGFFLLLVLPAWYGKTNAETNFAAMTKHDIQSIHYLALDRPVACDIPLLKMEEQWILDTNNAPVYYHGTYNSQELFSIVTAENGSCSEGECVQTCAINKDLILAIELNQNHVGLEYFLGYNFLETK